MPKISKSKASWQLGWTDALEHRIGYSLDTDGIDPEAYQRGVERGMEFIRKISAVS